MAITDDNKRGGTVPTNHNFKLKYIEVLTHISVTTTDDNKRGGTVPTHHNFKLKYREVLKH